MPWSDRTAGLSEGSTDAAFVSLPLPRPPYRWVTVAREARLVALSNDDRLAGRDSVSIADLLDEPFLALPASAGPLRDHWLALEDRGGHPARIAAEISNTEETYEAVASGIGICLLAAGNAPIFDRGAVTMLPVHDLGRRQSLGAPRRDRRRARRGHGLAQASALRSGTTPRAQPVLATVPVDVTVPLGSDGLRMGC
jgi:DNA-binding transcriptional LysR family regulator